MKTKFSYLEIWCFQQIFGEVFGIVHVSHHPLNEISKKYAPFKHSAASMVLQTFNYKQSTNTSISTKCDGNNNKASKC